MHIPNAVLSPQVAAATAVLGAGGLAYCMRRLERSLRDRTTAVMGTMAAFVFAAQMVNFPLFPMPISGHLIGGVLSAVLLGPWAGAVVVAAVLIVQSLVFGDGGLTALGANFLNMGLIGSVGGYAIYSPLRRSIGGNAGVLVGGMAAAWFSVMLAAGAFSVELAASGRPGEFLNVLSWMGLVHAGVALGEAVITGMVLRFILLTRPDMVYDVRPSRPSAPERWGRVLVAGLAVSMAVAVFLAPFASEYADGLEWVGARLGFLTEGPPTLPVPIPEYQLAIPGLGHPKLATAAAGAVGTITVFVVSFVLARGLSGRSQGWGDSCEALGRPDSQSRGDLTGSRARSSGRRGSGSWMA